LAVSFNERQDYFGQTVNIAARVQGLAISRSIFATAAVVEHLEAAKLLESSSLRPARQDRSLRGIADKLAVYEIP
jgi:class 3 adenylate cyclase